MPLTANLFHWRLIKFCLFFALLNLSGLMVLGQNDNEAPRLIAGQNIERELSGGKSHSYKIKVTTNQYLKIIVEQKGIDVVVELYLPDGNKLLEVDSPNGTQGPEPLEIIASIDGDYVLKVRSLEEKAPSGKYEVKVIELRTVTEKEKHRISAQKIFEEAKQFQSAKTPESLQNAIKKYEEVLPLFRSLNDKKNEAQTLNNIGAIYHSIGNNEKAIEYYEKAVPLYRLLGDKNGEADMIASIGAAVGSIGGILSSSAQTQKSIEYSTQARLLYHEADNLAGEMVMCTIIGLLNYSLGEMQKAIDSYKLALPLYRKIRDRNGEANTLNNIGNIYSEIGERQKALDSFLEALPIFRETKDRRGEAQILNNLGMIYQDLGEPQKGLEYCEQSLRIDRELKNPFGEAASLNNIGNIYENLGEKQKAIEYYAQALIIVRANDDRRGQARTLTNIGNVHFSLNENQKALDIYTQALSLHSLIGDQLGEARTITNIGNIYEKLGENQKAIDHHKRALLLLRSVGDRDSEAIVLYNFATLESKRGNLAESLKNIEAAIAIVESLRAKIGSKELRSSYFATVQSYYEFYIDLLIHLNKQKPSENYVSKALEVSERARARALLELLSEANVNIRQGVDEKLLESERSLQQRISARTDARLRLINSKHTKEQEEKIDQEIKELTDEYEKIEAQIRTTSPRYAALVQPQPLTLNDIQKKVLDKDTILLEYALGAMRSYLWVVTQDSIKSYELPKGTEIKNLPMLSSK